MAKKPQAKNTQDKDNAVFVIAVTLLIVTNAVWAFVMHDYQYKKKIFLADKALTEEILSINQDLMTALSFDNCLHKGDIWKIFADKKKLNQGIQRIDKNYWRMEPVHFYFGDNGCLSYENLAQRHEAIHDVVHDDGVHEENPPGDTHTLPARDQVDTSHLPSTTHNTKVRSRATAAKGEDAGHH